MLGEHTKPHSLCHLVTPLLTFPFLRKLFNGIFRGLLKKKKQVSKITSVRRIYKNVFKCTLSQLCTQYINEITAYPSQ